ncbi:MAG TPA: thioredoxin family protein [Victivallales bacterium]|nr:thioredoxin family protein [Victivallales bacterium]
MKILKTILIIFIGILISNAFKANSQCCKNYEIAQNTENPAQNIKKEEIKDNTSVKLPKMLELGSVRCMACKAMEPIIKSLKEKYSKNLSVEFIDVMQHYQIGEKYKIEVIPTQIFLDPEGKEIFRHVGFYSEEEIIKKWKELGYEVDRKN